MPMPCQTQQRTSLLGSLIEQPNGQASLNRLIIWIVGIGALADLFIVTVAVAIRIQRFKNEKSSSNDDDTQLATSPGSRLALKQLHIEERSSWMGGGVSSRDVVVALPGSLGTRTPTTFWQMRELVEEHAAWVDDPDEEDKSDYSLKTLVSEFYYGEPQVQSAVDRKGTGAKKATLPTSQLVSSPCLP